MDMDIVINQALRLVDIWYLSLLTVLVIVLVALAIVAIRDLWW